MDISVQWYNSLLTDKVIIGIKSNVKTTYVLFVILIWFFYTTD